MIAFLLTIAQLPLLTRDAIDKSEIRFCEAEPFDQLTFGLIKIEEVAFHQNQLVVVRPAQVGVVRCDAGNNRRKYDSDSSRVIIFIAPTLFSLCCAKKSRHKRASLFFRPFAFILYDLHAPCAVLPRAAAPWRVVDHHATARVTRPRYKRAYVRTYATQKRDNKPKRQTKRRSE